MRALPFSSPAAGFDEPFAMLHACHERHILPALRAQGQATLAERLAADHLAMTQAWQALRPRLAALAPSDAALAGDAARFCTLCRAHIALEEGSAFGRAQSATGAPAQEAMGREMAARRGVTR